MCACVNIGIYMWIYANKCLLYGSTQVYNYTGKL